MLARSRIIRPTVEDVFYIDRLNWEIERDPLSWQREWLRRVPRLELAPTLAGNALTGPTASANSHSINYPSSIAAGDLLVGIFTGINTNAISNPSGWTSLYSGTTTTAHRASFLFASGGESGTFSVSATSQQLSAIVLRITGSIASLPPEAATPALVSLVPNSPNLTPSGGSRDYLWVATAHYNATTNQASAPTNYGNLLNSPSGASNPKTVSATRARTASSEDPGAWPTNTGVNTIAGTIAAFPGASVPLFMHHYQMMRGN
jgi:hypothetical protein